MSETKIQFNAEVLHRFAAEEVIWLTTVSAAGQPQPTPVWFLWEGETFLIYSQPSAFKVGNIKSQPRVALNLNCDESGGNVMIIFGQARIVPGATKAHQNPAYLEKYRKGIADIGMTPESMSNEYSVAIRVTPDHVRSF